MNFLEKIREEGKIEGKIDKAIETARNMKDLGLTLDIIQKSVGLSEDELKENGIL
jgi:predicted transposase/invertase (TIGR01784 family)